MKVADTETDCIVTLTARKEEQLQALATDLPGETVVAPADVRDADRVLTADCAELVASAAGYTDSIHQGTRASVEIAGNGYQVQLPGCRDAGFQTGTQAPTVPGEGVLVIYDGTAARLADDLVTIRAAQISS